MSNVKKICLNVFFKDHNTIGEHLMSSARVFHRVAAAVSISRLPSFTVLLLLGTNDVLFSDLRCLVGWYQFNSSHR